MAGRPRTAAARCPARTRPRWTGPRPTARGTWPRTSWPRAWPTGPSSRSPTRSGWPGRCPCTSTRSAPSGYRGRSSWSWSGRTSTCARPRCATISGCPARSTGPPPPTATSAGTSRTSPGSAPTWPAACASRPAWAASQRASRSVRRGTHGEGLGSGEDLLVQDEREAEDVERGHGRDGQPHLPLLAGRSRVGDPASHWRQPEDDQRDADGDGLVEALVEDGVAVSLRPAEGREVVEQQQVQDDERPEDVGRPLQPLPVPAQPPLRRRIGRDQEWYGHEDHEQPGQQERV